MAAGEKKNNTGPADGIVVDTNQSVPAQPPRFFDIISINQSKNQFELDCIDGHEDGEGCLLFSY